MVSDSPSCLATATRVVVVAAPIYFIWEMAQAPLFTGMLRDWRVSTLLCALATIGDVILLAVLVALGFVLFDDQRWFTPPHVRRYVIITLVGLAAQVAIEWLAVEKLQLWGYQSWHPRVPLIRTGLIPFLQPLVIVPSALWIAARSEEWIASHRRSDRP